MRNKIIAEENIFPRWEHNIPTLGTKHSHAGNKTGLRLTCDEITARRPRHFSDLKGTECGVANGSFPTRLRLVVTLLLMLIVGVSGVCGADYKYVFINNKGNKAFNYSTDNGSYGKTKLQIHPKAKSVLATNFRFYTTEAAAVADANGTIGTAGTDYYTENTTISGITGITNNTFYVRYDIADDPVIDINAGKTYKLQIYRRDGQLYYIYLDPDDGYKLKINRTDDGSAKFIWRFESGDPYDVYMTNLQGLSSLPNGTTSASAQWQDPIPAKASDESSSYKQRKVNYQAKVTENYNQSDNPMACLQSFIITKNDRITWASGMYQIIGAYNGLEYKPRDGQPDGNYETCMPYYICMNTNNSTNDLQLEFYRSWRNESENANNPNRSISQITFTMVSQKYTFHIINNSGEEAISAKTASALNAEATITESMIPDVLKSPAASNYTYYLTAADAIAGENAITTLPQSDDIYVRYETSSDDFYLNGEIKYNLSVGGAHYLYATGETTLSSETTSENNTNDNHRWTLHGGDPYQFTIKNAANAQFITYDVSGGEAVPTLSGTGSKFFLHQSTNGKYELVAMPSNNYPTSYYTLGYNSTNGLKLYSNTNHPFEDDVVQTVIYSQLICETPVISFDNTTSQVTITCATDGATIHYTTNGSTPTESSQSTPNPFTINAATTVKAIATNAGYLTSEVATLAIPQVATPTIQNNGSNAISITSATDGATIYYTTDGSTPTTSSTEYTDPLTENVSNVTIKAIAVKENMIPSAVGSGTVTLQCEAPVIARSSNSSFTVTCAFPSSGVTIYYTTDGSTPTTSSSSTTSGSTISCELPVTVKAIAVATNYDNSTVTTTTVTQGMDGEGTADNPYTIEYQSDVADFITKANTADGASKHYKVIATTSLDFSSAASITQAFSGTFDGNFHIISNIGHALFNTIDGGIVKNVILQDVNISTGTNVGAICNEATGASRIYNCGILPTTVLRNDPDDEDKITGFSGSSIGGSGNVGGIVGLLSGNARVINCYSYATITGGATVAGIVGNIGYAANGTITQDDVDTKPVVVNCMFYGDITGGSNIAPVYGGTTGVMIKNEVDKGVNPYCYFRKEAPFHNKTTFPNLESYRRSWPAEEKNLTRFEYYRSILNSNKRLCTYWITDKVYGSATNAPTEADEALVAKWVLDLSIAPYPILKKWDKYPSVINLDPANRYNPSTQSWESRSNANEWEGKSYGTLEVKINAGSNNSSADVVTKYITITDMDTLNCDYGYYKIQLPYYNEVFGNPNGATHAAKYGNNYTSQVVTGWEITAVSGGTPGTFTANWETGYNFADRNCTNKDKYSVSGRVFAQGGYYYVPEGVSAITITAHWGKAVYLANRGHSIDRVKLTIAKDYKGDKPFTPAGTISDTFQGETVYNDLQDAIQALDEYTSNQNQGVYNQAIVLIGNHQVQNGSNQVGYGLDSKWHPFTIMSADFDFDNEPDYCLQLQFRNGIDRPGIQPVRFDFLPIVELGLAVRHNKLAYAIGIMVPQGHFEVTETAFMRTTQFEYDGHKESIDKYRVDGKSPMIINGGEFESFNVRYNSSNRTSYFILGGKAWIHRFAPGLHPNAGSISAYLCAVNAIGGEYPEFYLSGLYKAGTAAPANQGAPHCYTNGGKFGTVAGTGYDKVAGGVTFKVNHSLIKEFYGGGINGSNPLGGNIDVTIDYSRVNKYCGGPKVGDMTGKTVSTRATGTTFGVFYGGGNGGNSYYREMQDDGDRKSSDCIHNGIIDDWNYRNYHWNSFNPLGVIDDGTDNKGYHAEYEFEVFNQSNGVADEITQRGFIKWIQFGITKTGNVTNTLTDCKILNSFYGGGNLATVDGNVTSTLTNTEVDGSVFGAGYSAAIPTFQVHDKDNKTFPEMDFAGTITDGHIPYASTVYEWTNDPDTEEHDAAYMKAHPTYSKTVGGKTKWYCYTWNPLTNLGAVTGNATLSIEGTTTVAGSVYGGGEESSVDGNTEVNVSGGTIGVANAAAYGALVGNVYGGGKGKDDDKLAGLVKGNANVTISQEEGKTTRIYHNVYGGGAYGSVGDFTYDATTGQPTGLKANTTGGTANVTITGGTIGIDGDENGMVFGSSRGDVATPGTDGVDPNDRMAWVYSTHVIIGDNDAETSPTIKGSVYGSGENGHTFQNTIVDIKKGTIGIPTGEAIGEYSGAQYPFRGNVYGGGCGTDTYTVTENAGTESEVTHTYYNPLAGIVRGTATVNITGGHVVHNVYGAGAMGSVGTASDASNGKTTINISGGRVGYDGDRNGNVFGAARGEYGISTANSGLANVRESEVNISYATTPAADNEGKTIQLITGSVFGGGESGTVKESVTLKMTGGLILKDLYGGGALADTQTSNWDASANSNAGGWATGKSSSSSTTTVRLTGGTIHGEAYGGGLGEEGKPAYVYGDVLVELNNNNNGGTADGSQSGCAVDQVFGCNNVNGTPKGDVMVHVYATQNKNTDDIATKVPLTFTEPQTGKVTYWSDLATGVGLNPTTIIGEESDEEKQISLLKAAVEAIRYDVKAVYGGGNMAAYEPLNAFSTEESKKNNAHTNVIIDGCELTSIKQVYGGGNAASTPATSVTINGTYEIEEVFGGGNGKDAIGKDAQGNDIPNPGANVGFKDYSAVEPTYDTKEKRQTDDFVNNYVYGTGKASVNVYGGTIHRVFGGSNTKGNVRQTAVTLLDENSGCDFCVDEAYGGGKSAPMDAEAKLLMACIPGLNAAYGGAEAAAIQGNVTLNITNGTFDRVFGGNNLSGTINGSITVNIEEVGCKPIIIGELYGGGNQAGYSIYGYNDDETLKESGSNPYQDPQVNVKSFTSIGNIFGGGYGSGATMVGNPTVNINEVYGKFYNNEVSVVGENEETSGHYPIPSHVKGKIGAINNVFGGGNAAKVIGNTNVNIGTLTEVYVVKVVGDGDDLTGQHLYTRSGAGTTDSPYTYTEVTTGTANPDETYYEKKDVLGVDIRGDVYGGGNNAEVTGDTHVTIGKETTTTSTNPTPTP